MIFWHESSATKPGGTTRDGRAHEPGAANIRLKVIAARIEDRETSSMRYFAPCERAPKRYGPIATATRASGGCCCSYVKVPGQAIPCRPRCEPAHQPCG